MVPIFISKHGFASAYPRSATGNLPCCLPSRFWRWQPAELNFCKMQQLHRRKLRRPVGSKLVILYVVLRHAAKISRGFLPDFFQFCRRQKGNQKWRPKLGSVKLNFTFGGTVLGPRARSDKSSFRTFSSRFEMQLSIKLLLLTSAMQL